MQDGMLAEHWDVIEDQVTRSGLPMFGEKFPGRRCGSAQAP